ncbi:MAG: methyl-accepting chemotaxis protein [Synergistaceae bacterium]|nr:methyl-accepting chemotaxis protein [Synergistaceae bacterium]
MWRNLKIRFKLLLGFGLVLLVFMAAIIVTLRDLRTVKANSELMAMGIVPSMMLTDTFERETNGLFLLARLMEYSESEQVTEELRRAQGSVQNAMEELRRFDEDCSNIEALQYEIDKVFPLYGAYSQMLGKTVEAFAKKTVLYEAAVRAGEEMSLTLASLADMMQTAAGETDTRSSASEVFEQWAEVFRATSLVREKSTKLRLALTRTIGAGDVQGLKAIIAMSSSLTDDTRALTANIRSSNIKDAVAQAVEVITRYRAALEAFETAFLELEKFHEERNFVRTTFLDESSTASKLSQESVKNLSIDSISDLGKSIAILILSAAAAVVLGILVALFISRSISAPLGAIVNLAGRAGDGDLTIGKEDFGRVGGDELGMLVDALSGMISSQEDGMRRVVAVARDLSGGASSLSSISDETNSSMEEVKVSIEQVSKLSEVNGAALEQCNAGVQEMSAGAETVAQSATDSADFISHTTEVSNRAIEKMNEVIEGLHSVARNAKENESKIRMLVTSVENVSSFVSMITGIADQTNLLALNAAIEAARAGEVGRGFAVVAEEVRKLAEESARAAQNVDGIIVNLQEGAREAIESTVKSGELLKDNLTSAEGAQTELNGALKEMRKANDSIQNIAAVAEEQAASSREMSTAIDSATKSTMEVIETFTNIRRTSDETVQTARRVAEHARDMRDHATTLANVLSHFKLHEKPLALEGN